MLSRIAHATDFSSESRSAFLHALRLAVAARCRLDILHVAQPGARHDWKSFPHVREALAKWGLLDAGADTDAIEAKLGVRVAKIEIDHASPAAGLADFLINHRPDLLVLATHGREGLGRWTNPSVSEAVVHRTNVPALLIGPESHGFVEPDTGRLHLDCVLLPLAQEPAPASALRHLTELLAPVGATPDRFHLMNVAAPGDEPLHAVLDETGHGRRIELFDGPVVETILAVADYRNANLIALPTNGRHGFIDALRGGTTSRVLARATCPVLTLPLIATP